MTMMAQSVVFVGPTLKASDIRRNGRDFRFRPPVADGDVFRVVAAGASAIGIIDGYFETRPAIRHKEILWAISRGVRVYGAASMGALRAAELGRFGMIGVGSIYEAFADGRLENDDAVAVSHGPAELGFPAVSEALVDIQATVDQATGMGVLKDGEADLIVKAAQSLYFKDRAWPTIARALSGHGILKTRQREIVAAMARCAVSVKRQDAFALLDRLRTDRAASADPPGFDLPETPAFQSSRDRALDTRGG